MIEAVPKGFFRQDFILHSDDGGLVELDVSSWRERAEFELDGIPFKLYREGMRGDFVLERAGTVIARATKTSAFFKIFKLDINGHALTLRKISAWRRGFGVYENDQLVGSIMPVTWFSQRSIVEMPADWNLALQLFLFWIVLLMWKRAAKAAAS